MQLIVLRGDAARLEQDGQEPVTLHVDWKDDYTLTIDWSPAKKELGQELTARRQRIRRRRFH